METRTLPNEIILEEVARLLDEGREVVFRPKGSSMLPFIRGERDSVALQRREDVAVGDIVLVRLPGPRYVLHRVIALSPDGEKLTLMGDGNIRGTEESRATDVIGTVSRLLREGGRSVRPGSARLWRALLPVRRLLLGVYRRLPQPLR